jgi:polysaccharide export outer membrane protein
MLDKASIDHRTIRHGCLVFALALISVAGGCHTAQIGSRTWAPPKSCVEPPVAMPPPEIARELAKISFPDYIIEPPDILLIDAVKVVPKPPYHIESLDVLAIVVVGALPDRPIEGSFTVEPGGELNLGIPYGSVNVAGLDLNQAREAIRRKLLESVREPEITLSLVQSAGAQQIAGEHIVGSDGKVALGTYGEVYITGMTRQQARAAIEAHLRQYLDNPVVSVDIYAYNSKFYYVILQNAGAGDAVVKLDVTGNETVLDAISEINGLEDVSSKRIWISRPVQSGTGHYHILPVDWHALTQQADTTTNYQILPGDRLFVAEDKWMAINDRLAKFTAPFQRMFGTTLMGTYTARTIKFFGNASLGGGI